MKKTILILLILFSLRVPLLSQGYELWGWGANSFGQLGDGSNTEKDIPTQIGTSTNWQSVSAGLGHTLAIKSDGTLWGWGYNNKGQLGDGTNSDKNSPTKIGIGTSWQSISGGEYHTISLKSDGTLWAWGDNQYGQLGDGSNTEKDIPTQIGTATNWKAVSSGENHSIALKNDGSLWAWGLNNAGQLGDGTNTNKNTPIQIGTATDWKNIFGGRLHSFALKSNGSIWAWGYNNEGELGDGTNNNKNVPIQIGSDTDWKIITSRYQHTLALKNDGSLWAWGENTMGQLGNGTNTATNFPIKIGSSTNWETVVDGLYNSNAIMVDGTLWSWGYNNNGQLGDGTNTNKNVPTQIIDTNWQSISAGTFHLIALKIPLPKYSLSGFIKDSQNQPVANININLSGASTTSTQTKSDGSYSFSNLINGSYTITPQVTSIYTFTPVSKNTSINGASISSGLDFIASAIPKDTSGYELWAWGANSAGQLGDSTYIDNYIAMQIGKDTNWKTIHTSEETSFAIKNDGTIWGWGQNYSGELGDGTRTNKKIPTKIGFDNDWESISSGEHTLAIKSNGTLWAWGINSSGELGDGTNVDKKVPTRIGSDTDWKSISAGVSHTIAIKKDGTLWTWGGNSSGQLGDGTIIEKFLPTQIGIDKDWKVISAAYDHSIAIKVDGTLWSWGENIVGVLGLGDSLDRNVPTQIEYDNNWKSIYTGEYHTIAIRNDGSLWSWGYNKNGQLGNGTNIDRNVPTRIGSDTDWKLVTCGSYHSIAIKNNGTLWAWGSGGTNTPIQVGTGNNWQSISAGDLHSLALRVSTPKYSLSGFIKDSQNQSVANITLNLTGTSTTTTQTKSNGSYLFSNLVSGNYTITPQTTGSYTFAPTSRNIKISGANISSGLDFVASVSKFKVSGTVKENGLGVNNYSVYMTGNSKTFTTQTISDGSYSLSVDQGTYKIFVDTTLKISTPLRYNFVNINSDTSNFNFTLSNKVNYTITGKIIDLEKNADLPNVSLVMSGKASGTYTTNITGDYSIPVSNGRYIITPILDGFTFVPSSTTIDISDSPKVQNFSAIADKYNITGYLKENTGTSLPNFNVYLSNGSSTQTDINGYYLFNLRKGNYTIKPDVSTFKSSPDSIDVTVFKTDLPNNNFILTRPTSTYNISGDVVNASGVGISNVEVILSSKIVKTDVNGKFTFNNIAEGKHVIVPSSNEYYFEPTYTEILLNSNINNIKFKAIKLTELPNCISSRDTTLPSVYVFDPYLASKRGYIEVKNDCTTDYTITDIALSGNTNQFKIVGLNELLPIVISSYTSVNIPIEFKPTKAGLDSVYVRLIFGQKQMAVKVKSEGVDAGPGLPYTVLTMRTKPEIAKPGERVELYLLVPKANNYILTTNDFYEAVFTIKTQLVADLDTISTPNITKIYSAIPYTGISYPGKSNPNGYTTVKFQGRYIPQFAGKSPSFIDTLAKFQFIATLGNQDSTNIIINDFRWLSGGAKAEVYNDGIFRIIPCEAGGERLIGWRSQSKVTLQSISPNPTSEDITLRINSSDELNLEIEIINILGINTMKINYFTISKGDSEIKLDLKNIPSGFYTISLNTKPPQSPLEQVGGNVQSVFFKQ